MSKKDWNPDLYLKFNKERTQPSIDLVSRILVDNPSKIIDIVSVAGTVKVPKDLISELMYTRVDFGRLWNSPG